jgi:hypothetical protein
MAGCSKGFSAWTKTASAARLPPGELVITFAPRPGSKEGDRVTCFGVDIDALHLLPPGRLKRCFSREPANLTMLNGDEGRCRGSIEFTGDVYGTVARCDSL